jgi:hypothetical protein
MRLSWLVNDTRRADSSKRLYGYVFMPKEYFFNSLDIGKRLILDN